VVEFRHARWVTGQAMNLLRELNAAIASSTCRK
jgi:hypothetical protein